MSFEPIERRRVRDTETGVAIRVGMIGPEIETLRASVEGLVAEELGFFLRILPPGFDGGVVISSYEMLMVFNRYGLHDREFNTSAVATTIEGILAFNVHWPQFKLPICSDHDDVWSKGYSLSFSMPSNYPIIQVPNGYGLPPRHSPGRPTKDK